MTEAQQSALDMARYIRADVTKAKYTGARKTALISLLYGRGFTDTKI